jgi:hypothetical protein
MAKKRGKVSNSGLFDSTMESSAKASISDTEYAPKIRNTYSLTVETNRRLEYARATLRGITDKKVTKSDIIDASLRAALDELETRGPDSYIAIMLSR